MLNFSDRTENKFETDYYDILRIKEWINDIRDIIESIPIFPLKLKYLIENVKNIELSQ